MAGSRRGKTVSKSKGWMSYHKIYSPTPIAPIKGALTGVTVPNTTNTKNTTNTTNTKNTTNTTNTKKATTPKSYSTTKTYSSGGGGGNTTAKSNFVNKVIDNSPKIEPAPTFKSPTVDYNAAQNIINGIPTKITDTYNTDIGVEKVNSERDSYVQGLIDSGRANADKAYEASSNAAENTKLQSLYDARANYIKNTSLNRQNKQDLATNYQQSREKIGSEYFNTIQQGRENAAMRGLSNSGLLQAIDQNTIAQANDARAQIDQEYQNNVNKLQTEMRTLVETYGLSTEKANEIYNNTLESLEAQRQNEYAKVDAEAISKGVEYQKDIDQFNANAQNTANIQEANINADVWKTKTQNEQENIRQKAQLGIDSWKTKTQTEAENARFEHQMQIEAWKNKTTLETEIWKSKLDDQTKRDMAKLDSDTQIKCANIGASGRIQEAKLQATIAAEMEKCNINAAIYTGIISDYNDKYGNLIKNNPKVASAWSTLQKAQIAVMDDDMKVWDDAQANFDRVVALYGNGYSQYSAGAARGAISSY